MGLIKLNIMKTIFGLLNEQEMFLKAICAWRIGSNNEVVFENYTNYEKLSSIKIVNNNNIKKNNVCPIYI